MVPGLPLHVSRQKKRNWTMESPGNEACTQTLYCVEGKEQPWKPCADCRWFHTEGKARGMRGQREEVEKVGREEGWVGGGGGGGGGGGRRRGGGEGFYL